MAPPGPEVAGGPGLASARRSPRTHPAPMRGKLQARRAVSRGQARSVPISAASGSDTISGSSNLLPGASHRCAPLATRALVGADLEAGGVTKLCIEQLRIVVGDQN